MSLPTSTNVTMSISRSIPAHAKAIVVFADGGKVSAEKALPEGIQVAAQRILDAARSGMKARELKETLEGQGKSIVRIACVGIGKDATPAVLREASGIIGKYARTNQLTSLAVVVPRIDGIDAGQAAESIVEGFALGSFRYGEYKKLKSAGRAIGLTIVASPATTKTIQRSIDRGRIVAEAQNLARTIAFRPGNEINPLTLARLSQSIAKETGLGLRILDERQMKRLGMGGMLAVGLGSQASPPRMIALEYFPRGARGEPVLLVGKAVTFDTGGISIKPAERMGRMVFDKCGGMSVLGAMVAVARLKLPIKVVGIMAAAENHISERAFRPGDLLRMYNGTTVEVTNTDAEGRLVLGDAISWGIERYKPRTCIDLATLTGGVSVALGRTMAGIMGNDQRLVDRLIAAGKRQGEKMWQLPMPEEPAEMLKSDVADIVNSAGRDAHPLQGAAFLSFFVPDDPPLPWAHLDIAGVADTDKDLPLAGKGATGWGVRTLVDLLAEDSL